MKRFIAIILVSSFLLCSISAALDLLDTAGEGRLSSIDAICGQHSRLSFDTPVVSAFNNEKYLFDTGINTGNQLSVSRVIPDPLFLSYRWETSEWYPDTVLGILT